MATISVPDGQGLRIIVADGAGAHDLLDVEVPLAGSLSAEVIRTERTMIVTDASHSTLTQPMVSVAGVGPMILVPLALRTSTAGVLAVGRVRGARLSDRRTRLCSRASPTRRAWPLNTLAPSRKYRVWE